ncbi:MAG: CTP synthase, partial [Actinobacteria bacterium]
MAKHIFVTGGVVSSLGKGITAASIGLLLKSRGLKVSIQKLDPYLNVDPGTMSPFQHGEVFVTADGSETDLDLGHYERFIDENLTGNSNVTAGSIYWSIIKKERKGDFLGGTVQVIPHVTNEIKERILKLAAESHPDVAITEVGGTVGDIESLPFLEAIRQLKNDLGKENVLYMHVTLVPFIDTAAELKTKPTQHSVKELRSIGIQPDIIVCRTDRQLTESTKRKIALFCDIDQKAVIEATNIDNIYEIPLLFNKQKLDELTMEVLEIKAGKAKLNDWQSFVKKVKGIKDEVNIAIVGKYVQLPDAYISIYEALNHAGIFHKHKINLQWVDAEQLGRQNLENKLSKANGILVPGGFGVRGIEGKISAARYARENKIPYLGICLGMQCAVVEFARNIAGMKNANSW